MEYAYRNTRNNKKSLEAVTRDSDGSVIPLSKRFNSRSASILLQGVDEMRDRHEEISGLDDLYERARKDMPYGRALIMRLGSDLGAERTFTRDSLKGRPRAEQKVVEDYGGDARKLSDVFGGTMTFPTPEAVDAAAKEIEDGGYLPVQRIKKPHDRGGYWDYKFNFYGPNGTVIELIVADDYILGVKEGLGHALYDYTRQIGHILDEIMDGKRTLDSTQEHLLKEFNQGLLMVSDEIYSNPQFDLESMSKALSASIALVSSGQLTLRGLSTSFDKVLSKDNMTSWPVLLEEARNLHTSSSSQNDRKNSYPSKSSRLNAMGASNDNVASESYWGLVYDDVAEGKDVLFQMSDDDSRRISSQVDSLSEDDIDDRHLLPHAIRLPGARPRRPEGGHLPRQARKGPVSPRRQETRAFGRAGQGHREESAGILCAPCTSWTSTTIR